MQKSNKRSKTIVSTSISIIIIITLFVFSAYGFSTGRYDRARTGCNCHSTTPDPTVTASLVGQPPEYTPLSTYPLSVSVSGGPPTTKGGFNLEVSQGTLSSIDPNVQVNGIQNQSTHTNPNQRSWSVDWTAPSSGSGDVTIWLATNAVNGNGNNGGDGWNLFSQVVPEAPPPDIIPPKITNVLIDGVASKSVLVGTTVTLTATSDDTNSGNSDIAGANFTQGQTNWSSSTPMNAVIAPFDNPKEDVTVIIDTTLWLSGSYQLYVYSWDVVPNYNVSSASFATLTVFSEQIPPEISNVQLNSASSQSYPLSSVPTLILTATIDDSQTGNSDIAGANYTQGVQQFVTSQAMSLQNSPTSPTEVFEATITPPSSPGTYQYYVYGWDSELNHNTSNTVEFATLTLTDDLAPVIENVLVDGSNAKGVSEGTVVTLTATINESSTGSSNVAGANFTTGSLNWSSSTPLDPVLSPFDNPIEDVTITIDTTGWLPGSYELYVYAWDENLNFNFTSGAFATLVISSESIPPEISNVKINGAATQTYSIFSIPTLTLTATVDDSNTGDSNLEGANYTLGVQNWGSSQPMTLQNPPESPTEVFESVITAPSVPGTYQFYVYAVDSDFNGNYTNTAQFATLILIDDMPPRISNVLIDGLTIKSVVAGTIISLSAEIDDSSSGNSNIGGANYTISSKNWVESVTMDAETAPFDNPMELVKKTIDTTGWLPGSYEIYVYAWDDAQSGSNHNISSTSFVTLFILESPSNVQIETPTEEGKLVVNWDLHESTLIVGFRIYRSTSSGSGYELVDSIPSSATSYTDINLEGETTYYYVITGFDSNGNETSYSEEISATTVPSKESTTDDTDSSLIWIILVIVIIVIVIILFLMFIKKRA
jgi:hypothetical protein